MRANLYPLFLNLSDRMCVVVGGDEMAEGKIRELLDAGARIRVIASEVTSVIRAWAESGKLQWETRAYQGGDLRGAFLVVSIADTATNARVFAEAEQQHMFCNSVDDIARCNCYASAVVRRGPLQIAVSTAGNSPALAQRIRKELEEQFGEDYGPWVEQLGEERKVLLGNKAISIETRRKLFHEQASAEAFEKFQAARTPADDSHASPPRPKGSSKPD